MRIKKHFQKFMVILSCIMVMMISTAVFAESETANSALVAAASDVAASITANVNAVLPTALGLMALIAGIMIGIKVFNKLKNKATSG